MDEVFQDRVNADDVARKNRVHAEVVDNKCEAKA